MPEKAIPILRKSGLNCKKSNFKEDLSVFVCTAYRDTQIQEIQEFVAEGGGLLIGGHAWYWAQSHPNKNLFRDFSGMIKCIRYFQVDAIIISLHISCKYVIAWFPLMSFREQDAE